MMEQNNKTETEKELDRVHDTLTDLLCAAMEQVPYERPQVGDWCYEMSSFKSRNRDCRIGILLRIIDPGEGRYITKTIGGKEIHWDNARFKKIPSDWLRNPEKCHEKC